ncbi:MAG: HAMP domain-containing sensor histidine kinase, partial [Opitutales bacterium]
SLAVLAIFGGIVAYVTFNLREDIRGRILDRAASSLEQVVTSEYRRAEETALLKNAELIEMDLIDLAISSEQIIDEIALWCLELPDVQSIALHDLQGSLRRALPNDFDPLSLSEGDRATLGNGIPQVHFLNESMAELVVGMAFLPEEGADPTGYARFLLDGASVADEVAALDDNLSQQAGIAFGTGALLITAILWFFFHRLRRSSLLLAERGRKLEKANDQLILASKSAALGSVSAHLMHGLKNPLAGLREYVKDREANDPADEEVRLVSQAARSMQTMVEEALQVLQEHRAEGVSYAFTTEEMLAIVEKRLTPLAENKDISIQMPEKIPEASIDNMQANLLVLALFNLGQNAIEATGEKGTVSFSCDFESGNHLAFRVRDEGPGLPEDMLDAPFAPRTSRKQGGTGVGLAISQQLAERAGAQLTLESNGPDGACFLVRASLNGATDDG